MIERWGTIFEMFERKMVRHKALGVLRTECGIEFHKSRRFWMSPFNAKPEQRCKKCYPVQRVVKKRRKSWA